MFRPIALYTCLLSFPAFADADPPRPVLEGPVHISGPVEVVFDWTMDRCDDRHFADLPVRAFRDDGAITLILPHDVSHRMRGPDFDNLHADCAVLLASTIDQHPDQFANYEWIAASYLQGDTVHALIHNEYQGNRYLGCDTYDYFSCWYNTITYAASFDGGATFGYPVAPPLATQHPCLMRTATLGDPDSWRYFDGAGFNGIFADPYRDDLRALRATTCTPLALPEIAQMYEGVTWNTVLERFILIGTSSDPSRADNPYGFYYALSEDLITWTRRTPLLEVRLPWRATGRETVYLYPTLIDHASNSANFETSGADAYLYFTRLNFGSGDLDRDLLRMPVRITAP